jgi:hypothetical protein
LVWHASSSNDTEITETAFEQMDNSAFSPEEIHGQFEMNDEFGIDELFEMVADDNWTSGIIADANIVGDDNDSNVEVDAYDDYT